MAAFTPNTGEIIVGAFARLSIRRTELTVTHLSDARHEANLLQAQWGNRGPNLWTVDQQELQLTQGTLVYPLPSDTIEVLEVYISSGAVGDTGEDAGSDANVASISTFDRQLSLIGRDDYLDISNKQKQGRPNSVWFQRGLLPKLNVWPSPDQSYTLYFWRTRQIGTASISDGASPEVPYLWIDAFTAGLAHRLARIYAPQMEGIRKADATEAWQIAADQDTEKTPMYISPDVGRYYR